MTDYSILSKNDFSYFFSKADDYNRFFLNRGYEEIISERLYSVKIDSLHDHNLINENYFEKYPMVIWQEGQDNTLFVKKRMNEVYAKYPVIGNYDINPEIFKPNIFNLLKMNMDDEE